MRNSRNRKRRKYRVNSKRICLIILALILITIVAIFGINKITTNNTNDEIGIGNSGSQAQEIEKEKPKDVTINLVATGDIMCHSTNFKAAYNSETKTYDFTQVFANVAKYITNADIAIRKLRNHICRRS